MTNSYRKRVSVLTHALFPRRCPVCGSIVVPLGRLICPSCLNCLSFVKSPVCKKCGKEVMSEMIEYCFDCTKRRRSFEYGIALLNYDEVTMKSMAAIKYKNKREYLDFYAEASLRICGEQLRQMGADALIPVPVHPSRLRKRGFNQAEILANGLEYGLGLPVITDLLKRDKKTEPQKILDPSQRLKNLEKAFQIQEIPDKIRSVIVVDDIYTTGSTIEACARVLRSGGIKSVYFFTVCIGHGQ